MPNCLGIYAENNIIKYAKLSTDKSGGAVKLASYGVRFGENVSIAIEEIIKETNSAEDSVATNIVNEHYESVEFFSKLKKQDVKGVVTSEFANICDSKGLLPSVLEMKFRIAKNTGDSDKYRAICAYTNKAEITNIFNNFNDDIKISSISPLGSSAVNLLQSRGLEDDAAIINIENETVVTVVRKGEIVDMTSLPLGMRDVLPKLAEKYNSYAKAYEACKGVSAYIEDVYALDESDRDVLDVLIPMLYELRLKIEKYLAPHISMLNKIYLTGSGVIINNLDLYFHEVFHEKSCQILVPYFMHKDSNNLSDILEVNSATALAFNGLGYNDRELEFIAGQSASIMQGDALKKKFYDIKDKAVEKFKSLSGGGKSKSKSSPSVGGSKNKKISIEFNDEVVESNYGDVDSTGGGSFADEDGNFSIASAGVSASGESDSEEKKVFLTEGEAWFVRVAGMVLATFCLYWGASTYTRDVINEKIAEINTNKAKINSWISQAEDDRLKIDAESQKYETMQANLEELLDKVTTRTVSFDIPNFMSKLMFVIPEDVQVTSIVVRNGNVVMNAESGQYSQLGYFVSRLKLDKVLTSVDMSVESMSGKIKIKISGVMP